ncbi:MAG: hypothetical protein ACOYOK_00550 [Pseudobdellovibrionaceae bacterium]
MVKPTYRFILLGLIGFSLSCAKKLETANDSQSTAAASAPESAYCGTATAVSGTALTVTGSAEFKYRPTVYSGGEGYLSWTTSTAEIPYAEVHVYDSSGARIQCGETDSNGAFSLQIRKSAGNFTVKVFSRSFNSYYKVSVLEDITGKTPYSISKAFTATDSTGSSLNVGTLTAEADENISSKLEGGAFNILFNILTANEFIRTQISDSSWVADKVTIYWKMGFNPYSYFGSPDSLLSFYSSGNRELYILGGKNSDVKTSDTDHFDDSVILHEYGHFLEDVYGKSESPGGSHNGNSIIDPRLAWSEGWANYFQAAVKLGTDPTNTLASYYIDTRGYKSSAGDTTAGQAIAFRLTDLGGTSAYDSVSSNGEGTYREVSISRTLYKSGLSGNYSAGKAGAAIPFADIWSAFSSSSNGLKSSSVLFRSIGMFNQFLNSPTRTNANWDAILSEEKQNKTKADYGDVLQSVASNGCSTLTMTPVVDTSGSAGSCSNGTVVYTNKSNLLKSNRFFAMYHDGSSYSISLVYTSTGTDSTKADLDLILYNSTYIYHQDYLQYGCGLSSSYIAKQSRNALSGGSTSESESIDMSGVPAGWYLMNVKARTYNKLSFQVGGTATYRLVKSTGGDLCPQTQVP